MARNNQNDNDKEEIIVILEQLSEEEFRARLPDIICVKQDKCPLDMDTWENEPGYLESTRPYLF